MSMFGIDRKTAER